MAPNAARPGVTSKRIDEGTNPQRKCNTCYIPASEQNRLQRCSRCRAAMYCSRECQAADWKKHKEVCVVNAAGAAQLAMFDAVHSLLNVSPKIPCGWTLTELDKNIEKWIKFYNQALSMSTVHALKLPVQGHFHRARTHALRIEISVDENHGGRVGKYFKLDAVEVKSIEEGSAEDGAWKLSFDQLKEMRDDSERRGRGLIVAAAIECKPLSVQIVPCGSIKEMYVKRMKWIEKWEEKLRRCIETGNMNFGA